MKKSAAGEKSLSRLLKILGFIFLFLGLSIFLLTFYPVIKEEINYSLRDKSLKFQIVLPSQKTPNNIKRIEPMDSLFGIIIPKIGANAKVIPNVDPFNSQIYQWELTKGVAHAKGSSLPDKRGNVFIFAHSAGNFFEANRFNAVFYLLYKLNSHDDIYLFYKNQEYHYRVTKNEIVAADSIKYLTSNSADKTLTLMTCWPPGTTLKRLVVTASLKK